MSLKDMNDALMTMHLSSSDSPEYVSGRDRVVLNATWLHDWAERALPILETMAEFAGKSLKADSEQLIAELKGR